MSGAIFVFHVVYSEFLIPTFLRGNFSFGRFREGVGGFYPYGRF